MWGGRCVTGETASDPVTHPRRMRLGVPPHPIGPVGPDRPGRHFQTRQVPVERRSGPCRPDSECGPEHSAARVSGPLPHLVMMAGFPL